MKSVYLAGPINGCSDAECNDWRQHIQQTLAGQFAFLDPMRRDYRGREEDSVVEIVAGDKQDIAECDIFLANCPKPSYGTAMEIYIAWQLGKTVVIVLPKGAPVSPWLRFHSTRIVNDYASAIVQLQAKEQELAQLKTELANRIHLDLNASERARVATAEHGTPRSLAKNNVAGTAGVNIQPFRISLFRLVSKSMNHKLRSLTPPPAPSKEKP